MDAEEITPRIMVRFWSKVTKTNNCWLWTGSKHSNGYGQFTIGKKNYLAHRFSYQINVEELDSLLVLDHLCRNKSCVRPDHLEQVTSGENVLRGIGFTALNAKKTHCPQGHEYSEGNVYLTKTGHRQCAICKTVSSKETYQKNKVELKQYRASRKEQKKLYDRMRNP